MGASKSKSLSKSRSSINQSLLNLRVEDNSGFNGYNFMFDCDCGEQHLKISSGIGSDVPRIVFPLAPATNCDQRSIKTRRRSNKSERAYARSTLEPTL